MHSLHLKEICAHSPCTLQALLARKLNAANEKAQRYGPVQSGWAASMLRLDVYRQVFDILINSMTTYKPVLRKIRKYYDTSLENAVKTSFDNMHLRSEISLAESKKRKAVDDTLAECAKNALVLRDQLFAQLTDAQVRAEKLRAMLRQMRRQHTTPSKSCGC